MQKWAAVLLIAGLVSFVAPAQQPLPGTAPLTIEGDLAMKMLEGMDAWLTRETAACREKRAEKWNRDFSSREAYIRSIDPNRQRFRSLIGVVDERVPVQMEHVTTVEKPALIAQMTGCKIYEVRWPVLDGVHGEGLLFEPVGEARANIVAMGDCDISPEGLCALPVADGAPGRLPFPVSLASYGCRVIVPVLINRSDDFSANSKTRSTNQPHREFVNRHAFNMGRHIIGYEVQKVLAAVDWLQTKGDLPLGVIGYGEGGLVAFYAAAVDQRIDAACVSGYFQPRDDLCVEPIYRNVWSLLTEFGDAEIASLIAPRCLIIEAASQPEVTGPPPDRDRHHGGAPGVITTPPMEKVAREFDRARALVARLSPQVEMTLIEPASRAPGDPHTLTVLAEALGIQGATAEFPTAQPGITVDIQARMKRQVWELVEHTQRLMRESPLVRAKFWEKADPASLDTWQATTAWYRDYFHKEIIGELPPASIAANPRTRVIYDEPEFTGYEVVLDVHPDVFAYGILLVPKDLKAGERRPVVVCQHGLEGRPQLVADPNANPEYYHRFGAELAKRGYITYAPQNPYIHGNVFRQLQRKANPVKLSFFSFVLRQHERTLEWLASLPFVQPDKIAFYGLSYGGKTAMRVPAILPGYCLSICSGDFNEWIWKIVDTNAPFGYPYTHEYEILEWNMGNTFNYGELSWLIVPRPFMVERGHSDGVGIDEWVAYEYARTKRQYDLFNLGDKTEIEYFNGPHEIHSTGTFAFLDKWLKK